MLFFSVSPNDVIFIQSQPTHSRGSTQHLLSPWRQPLHPPASLLRHQGSQLARTLGRQAADPMADEQNDARQKIC